VILPPVGRARSAILLLEGIERYFGHASQSLLPCLEKVLDQR
jgi:hypothetical protein